MYDKLINSDLIVFFDVISLNSYFYDYDRKTESVIVMLWEELKNVAKDINDILKNYIHMLDLFNLDDETMKKIEEWKWWVLWIIESDKDWKSTFNIWRWINLQKFKNLLILYIDNFSSEELNQIIWRVERLWSKDKKNIVLVKRTDINNKELKNYISRIKELWVKYVVEREIDNFINKLKNKKNKNHDELSNKLFNQLQSITIQ